MDVSKAFGMKCMGRAKQNNHIEFTNSCFHEFQKVAKNNKKRTKADIFEKKNNIRK